MCKKCDGGRSTKNCSCFQQRPACSPRCSARGYLAAERKKPWAARVNARMNSLRQSLQKQERRRTKFERREKRRKQVQDAREERKRMEKERLIQAGLYKEPVLFEYEEWNEFLREDHEEQKEQRALDTDPDWTSESKSSVEITSWRYPVLQKKHPYPDRTMQQYEKLRREDIGKRFHGFLHLPVEVRQMIYRLLLVRGKMFVPNSVERDTHGPAPSRIAYRYVLPYNLRDHNDAPRSRYKDFREPAPRLRYDSATGERSSTATTCFGLLKAVSRQVQSEAEMVFWTNNNIVFPAGPWWTPQAFVLDVLHVGFRILERPPAAHLSFAFSMRDGDGFGHEDAYARRVRAFESLETRGIDPKTVTRQQLRGRMHHDGLCDLCGNWTSRCGAIRAYGSLKCLQLDFEECFCIDGCCRLVGVVCNELKPWAAGHPPERLEILNWMNPAEKSMIRDKLCKGSGIERERVIFVKRESRLAKLWWFEGEFCAPDGEGADEEDEDDGNVDGEDVDGQVADGEDGYEEDEYEDDTPSEDMSSVFEVEDEADEQILRTATQETRCRFTQ